MVYVKLFSSLIRDWYAPQHAILKRRKLEPFNVTIFFNHLRRDQCF
uniref:Uncharacterized protein n=1 Tax=Arundo donax TaxID=35708 RepID=A0A0A9ABP3_ARUDO